MAVVVEFHWRTAGAIVYVSFVSASGIRIDVAAVIAPVFPQTQISQRLADSLERYGCIAPGGNNIDEGRLIVQGTRIGPLQVVRRAGAFPLRIAPGTRAELMLGLDFMSLFRECRLNFSGPVATLSLDPFGPSIA